MGHLEIIVRLIEPWRPAVRAPSPPMPRAYAGIVDELIAGFLRGDPEWCLETVLEPTIDLKCSGIRAELREKTLLRDDLTLLTLKRAWITPCQVRGGSHEWKRHRQGVRLWLVERDVNDPRTQNLLTYHLKREHEDGRKKFYDKLQRRYKKTSITSIAPELPPISAELDILRRSYRLHHDGPHWETIDAFKIRLDISDDMTLEEWAAISKYPVGEAITPEQEAAWLAVWAPDGMPEPERPETFQEQQLRWMREGGWNEQEQAANDHGLPMPKMMVQPGRKPWEKT